MPRLAHLAARLLALSTLALPLAVAAPAIAEVRFGSNVRIGGHDASNQRFDSRNRGVYHIYEGRPRNPGCTWRADGRGGRVKICHLQRIRQRLQRNAAGAKLSPALAGQNAMNPKQDSA